jgi:hypothetical protein
VGGGKADVVVGVIAEQPGRPRERGLTRRLAVGGTADGSVRMYDPADGKGYVADGSVSVFPGGVVVRAVVADVNGDGAPDQVFGAGPGGGSRVRVVFGVPDDIAPVALPAPPVEFDAFEPAFTAGVFVAAADLDGDRKAEVVVTPDQGGSGRVSIFAVAPGSAPARRDNFFGIADATFRGGARPAVGDVNGDGRPDLIVAAGFGGGPRVAIFDGQQLLANAVEPGRLVGDFFAFPGEDAERLRNGVYGAAGDLNADGKAELVFGGGPGGGPRVYALDGAKLAADLAAAYAAPVANFFAAGDADARGGVRLAVKDLDGDGVADLVAASGENRASRVRVYASSGFPRANGAEPPLAQELDPFGAVLADGVFVG